MQKGFNSDVMVGDQKFHVQTEDWGQQNPFIVSRIFRNGAVHRTIKTSYSEVFVTAKLQNARPSDEEFRIAIRNQHNSVIENLIQNKS